MDLKAAHILGGGLAIPLGICIVNSWLANGWCRVGIHKDLALSVSASL